MTREAHPNSAAFDELLHETAERARALGFKGVAPWRTMCWFAMDMIREELPADEALQDLQRLARGAAAHVEELGGPS